MPELPEVEAARRALEAHCVGRRIARCVVADDPKVVVAGVSHVAFQSALVGKTIVAARRRGKNLWLRLDSPPFPSFQFGMTGAIYIKGVPVTKYKRSVVNSSDEWPSKYSKVFVGLDDGLEFSFTDKRRFAKVRLFEDPETVPPISELGPDALFEPMAVDNFVDSLSGKKIGIKALLLDQSFISGIGNWIADEVLYQSRIHPSQIASSLSTDGCESLHRSIHEVVKYAVDVDADCDRFPEEWLFHHRWGKKPGKVNGKKIEFITAGGRTTAYVPELQKLTGIQSSKLTAANTKRGTGNGNVKEADSDEEDEDNLKSRKRVKTYRTNKRQQNKDGLAMNSRKPRQDGNHKEELGSEYSDADDDEEMERKNRMATTRGAKRQPNKDGANSVLEQVLDESMDSIAKKTKVTRTSTRKKSKSRQENEEHQG